MDLIKVKIEKDENTVKYIKLIREFDSSLSIGDIKKRIESNETVFEFDLYSNDWLYSENMTQYKMHRTFYKFLENLIENGAKIDLVHEYEVNVFGLQTEKIDMKSLNQIIEFHKEIWDEVENNPD